MNTKYYIIKQLILLLCAAMLFAPRLHAQCVTGISINNILVPYESSEIEIKVNFSGSAKLQTGDQISLTWAAYDCDLNEFATPLTFNVDYGRSVIIATIPQSRCDEYDEINRLDISIKPAGCSTTYSGWQYIKQLPITFSAGAIDVYPALQDGIPVELKSLSGASSFSDPSYPPFYQWEKYDYSSCTWSIVPGATLASYSPGLLAATTSFRRKATINYQYGYTLPVEVKVILNNPVRKGNSGNPISTGTANNYITTSTPYTALAQTATFSSLNSMVNKTFYDGLGRPVQEIAMGQSPNKKDIIRSISYNISGRQSQSWLPYERTGTSGTFATTALADQKTFYTSGYTGTFTPNAADAIWALSEKVFENSPVDRVIKEYAPGDAWKDKPITYNYSSNTANEVRLWTINTSGEPVHGNAYYAAGQLYVTETADEDGMKTREFKNKQGNVVERWQVDKANAANRLKTAYVYDYYGKLRAVVPPKAYDMGVTTTEFKSLLFIYSYDNRGRMITKKLPDKEIEYFVYDKIDRLVMAQDGEMRAKAKWKVLFYDKLNRLVAEALIACTKTRAELETAFAGVAYNQTLFENTYTVTSISGMSITPNDILKYTFYDQYKWNLTIPYNETAAATAITATADRLGITAKGQVTGSRVKALDNNEFTTSAKWLTNVTHYDKKYRAIQAVGDLYDGTTGTTSKATLSSKYHFDGAVERTREEQTFNSVKNTVDVRFEYDHARRPVKVWNKINSQTEQLLATTAYDALGRAKTKTLGNGEAVTYAYNIRDWLTKISSSKFTTDLYYNTLPTLPTGVTGAARWNGNIAAATWKQGTGTLQTYGYNYDAFNRLASGLHGGGMNEKAITYDANGNIATLTRDGGTNPGVYTYTYSGNRLVTLKIGSTSYNYTYDANGNVTTDGLRGFAISYNLLNLPNKVSKGTDNVEYVYDADGNKLAKKKNGAFVNFYCGSMVYKADKSIEYIAHSEGLAMKNTAFDYQYNLTDHLGNVRTVLDASKTALQTNDYYPFGLTHAAVANVAKNKYLYNGKELQNDVLSGTAFNVLDYGARLYDAVIGRFNRPDRFAEKYTNLSTYQYAANNPIRNIDVNGDSIWYTIDNKVVTMHVTGKVINQSGDNINMKRAAMDIASGITDAYSGTFEINGEKYELQTDVQLEAVSSMDDVAGSDHLFVLADADGKGARGATSVDGGKVMTVSAGDYANDNWFSDNFSSNNTRTTVHEFGHAAGLGHTTQNRNLMKQGVSGTNITSGQRQVMYNRRNTINRGTNSYMGKPYPFLHYYENGRWNRGHINQVGLQYK